MRPRVRDRTLPLREVAQQATGGAGGLHFIGTPEQLAAHVIAWQDARSCGRIHVDGIDTAA